MRRSFAACFCVFLFALGTPVRADQPIVIQVPPEPTLVIEPTSRRTITTVEGFYPQDEDACAFHQRAPVRTKYRGRLTLTLSKDGRLTVVNRLSFSDYLRGLAEVPLSWPQAALRAQIIAARSYALDAYRRGRSASTARGYDICSTDQCQVYRGATIELGAFGDRWVNAVKATRGKVLSYEDRVIQAFYFSTSDGKTRRSFPGGTPQPWLPSVDGEDDDAPLANWTAQVRLADIGPILRAADAVRGSVTSISKTSAGVRITGSGGSRTMDARTFRNALNNQAPCLFPKRYPDPDGSASGGRLPQTVPSITYTLTREGPTVIIKGRGWGHGIGMSQFGARSLASRGRSATQILKHFYGPANVTTVTEPSTLRVLAAEGVKRLRISIAGGARIRTETGSVLTGNRFEITGGDSIKVRHWSGPRLKPVLVVTPERRTLRGTIAAPPPMRFTASRPAIVHVELFLGTSLIARTKVRSVEAGVATITLPTITAAGEPIRPGSYSAVIVGDDGLDRVRAGAVAIELVAETPVVRLVPLERGRAIPLTLGGIALIAVIGAWLRVRSRARASRM